MLTEVKRTMHEQNKNVNKEKEILPNKIMELKNTITELKE